MFRRTAWPVTLQIGHSKHHHLGMFIERTIDTVNDRKQLRKSREFRKFFDRNVCIDEINHRIGSQFRSVCDGERFARFDYQKYTIGAAYWRFLVNQFDVWRIRNSKSSWWIIEREFRKTWWIERGHWRSVDSFEQRRWRIWRFGKYFGC